jgi:5'(3')-deoxyribonucleotidase
MSSRRDFVLGVDLDGVCADFYGAGRVAAAHWLGVDVETLTPAPTWGLPEWNLACKGTYTDFHRHLLDGEFFRTMPQIPGATESLRRISEELEVRIRIITHRLYISGGHREAAGQTVDWLEDNKIPYWDLCLVADKPAVEANLYIEDSPRNILALREQRHPTVIFTNSTNLEMEGARAQNWADVELRVAEQVSQARFYFPRDAT